MIPENEYAPYFENNTLNLLLRMENQLYKIL